ncbi:MAG: hypothetical protein Kow0090_19910 [Myxococcota bacterium]
MKDIIKTLQEKREKRRFPRIEVQLKVDIKTTYIYTTASVINISERGLFIRTQNPLPVGSEIGITLYFPAIDAPLTFMGVVRWNRNMSEDVPGGMGVELINPSDELLKTLRDQIARTPKNF